MDIIHGIKWKINKKLEKKLGKRLEKKVKQQNFLKLEKQNRKQKIIVSLTSFPQRFSELPLCLKSLLLQSEKPDKIIVWLGSDVVKSEFPSELNKLVQYGIEFRFDDRWNLKPHKKYIYAMREFPEDIVITVDDDVIYPSCMIEELLKMHCKFPKAVCAGRVHRMLFDKNDNILPYDQWMHGDDLTLEPSRYLIAIGIGGVLYPPHCLDERVFDIEAIFSYCLEADDLWLKCAEISNSTLVVYVPKASRFLYTIEEAQEIALCDTNVKNKKNDVFLRNAMEYFQLSEKEFEG